MTGTNGDCVDLPVGATGVATNVTAVNPTAPSNLRIFPADQVDVPTVSNLNDANGSTPTPNKVDSKLSPDGKIRIFNAFGSVDVIVDVVGVYTNTSLVEIQNRLLALEAEDDALDARRRPDRDTVIQRHRRHVRPVRTDVPERGQRHVRGLGPEHHRGLHPVVTPDAGATLSSERVTCGS